MVIVAMELYPMYIITLFNQVLDQKIFNGYRFILNFVCLNFRCFQFNNCKKIGNDLVNFVLKNFRYLFDLLIATFIIYKTIY